MPSTRRPPPAALAPAALSPGPLSTAALCERAGVTRGLLRVYEREGLLEAPPRSEAGYRLYAADTPARLTAIRQLKEVGFSLREIALLLAERDVGRMSATRLRRLAQEQLGQIDQRIARLQVVREYVAAVAAGDLASIDDPACDFLLKFLGAAPPAVAGMARARPVPPPRHTRAARRERALVEES